MGDMFADQRASIVYTSTNICESSNNLLKNNSTIVTENNQF